ncbi:TetR/AcrR family transcriptional regulator [Streptomyces sp. Tu102]|uniref:TetR/AcrR family transcriptional regulator n=1 Tax=Streptomyces TaxID=1883 RepID=UPI001BDC6E78|nr:TetR/AcrR family transcriptional regulator [Streptomyces sp. Tu102]MBT1093457.1 TetR/AcrR family transcriptional regulator [Streptomyces sp. Tu102]
MSDPALRRSYQSPLREERAAETRARIVAAARELFASEGFAATTVAMIATRAKVSKPTVHATFGTKAAIIVAMLGELAAANDREGWGRQIQQETDPRGKLALYASFLRKLYANNRDVWTAAIDASGDPSVVALKEQGERDSRQSLEPVVASLVDAGVLREGLTPENAVERVWMLSALELYFRADRLAWTDDEYESWLAESLAQQLLR